jgi:hypothetical protein
MPAMLRKPHHSLSLPGKIRFIGILKNPNRNFQKIDLDQA